MELPNLGAVALSVNYQNKTASQETAKSLKRFAQRARSLTKRTRTKVKSQPQPVQLTILAYGSILQKPRLQQRESIGNLESSTLW